MEMDSTAWSLCRQRSLIIALFRPPEDIRDPGRVLHQRGGVPAEHEHHVQPSPEAAHHPHGLGSHQGGHREPLLRPSHTGHG